MYTIFKIILDYDKNFYPPLIGRAMGAPSAPTYIFKHNHRQKKQQKSNKQYDSENR